MFHTHKPLAIQIQMLHFIKVVTVSGPDVGVYKNVRNHRSTGFIQCAVHCVPTLPGSHDGPSPGLTAET
jgi:hypothetical protein